VLKERGIAHKPLLINIHESELQRDLQQLESKKRKCLARIKTDMEELVSNLDEISTCYSGSPKDLSYITNVRNEIAVNLNHLLSGKSIDKLPYPFEQVNYSESETEDLGAETADKSTKHPTSISSTAQTENLQPALKKLGIFSRVWKWLNSPMSESWKNIK